MTKSPEIVRLRPDCAPETIAKQLAEDGCVIVEDVASPELRERLFDELRDDLSAGTTGGDAFFGESTVRLRSLVARSDVFLEFLMHPLVKGGAEACIRAHNTSIQLHFATLIGLGPDESAQDLHRDQWAWDFHAFPRERDYLVNCMWALTDFTADNGGTQIVPRSSRLDDIRPYPPEEAIAAEMSAGSVMLFTGGTYHGGGRNTTDQIRYGMIIGYAASWLRQEENQYLCVPHERAAALPEDVQKLIGYDQLYALGYVDQHESPRDFLREGRSIR